MEEYKKAYDLVARMLSMYPRTVFEVKKKLCEKGFKEKTIEKVIEYFKEEKILSDKNYAKIWLENQLKYRPAGKSLCRKKMIDRGLNVDLVNEILEEDFSEEKEVDLAYRLADKKLVEITNRSLKQKDKISKVGHYLNRKGFSENIIWNVLEKLDLLS